LIHVFLAIEVLRVKTIVTPAEKANILDCRRAFGIDMVVFELPA